ncbi:MAG: phosphoadenylyl-sulfate reductase [Bacteroidota bacterium]|nr:phosphoadenylyl-sulfate reductase [Bacteroidota bacterium]
MEEKISNYISILNGKPADEIIRFFGKEFPGEVAFATSLGAEDQVLFEMISKTDPSVHVFTLDTGRLFPETYDLMDISEKKYGMKIKVMFPDAASIQKMVSEHGINLFFDSIENRKLCCRIRKVEPMLKALKGMKVWITGLRRSQSENRKNTPMVEWDDTYGLIKVNPLFDWSEDQVWEYLRSHKIPYNTLHDKGFRSIGCQPCTRAVLPGEDLRAGRWWWEESGKKECGIHLRKNGLPSQG